VEFKLDNSEKKWKIGNDIRVISLNEEDSATFVKLKPYFIKRMEDYGNTPISMKQLKIFDAAWNKDHQNQPDLQVRTRTEKSAKLIDRSPKVTKDDNILSLTKK
jgi:hypothetical protein